MRKPEAERLKQARLAAGWVTAAEAARAYGWPVSTYLGHENGSRGYRLEDAKKYARAFHVANGASHLLLGTSQGRQAAAMLPVVSFVGPGGTVFDAAGPLDEIEAPPNCPAGAFAVRVRGDSWHPVYEDGDTLVCVEEPDVESLLYRRAIVDTADGRRMVKQIARGPAAGRYTLMSTNAPPIEDVRIERAARIKFVIPRA